MIIHVITLVKRKMAERAYKSLLRNRKQILHKLLNEKYVRTDSRGRKIYEIDEFLADDLLQYFSHKDPNPKRLKYCMNKLMRGKGFTSPKKPIKIDASSGEIKDGVMRLVLISTLAYESYCWVEVV